MRVDGQGRIFYIDHIHQKTAWTPPCILEALEESNYFNKNCENICDENRVIRQTMEFSKNNINLTIPQTPKQMALNILLSKELFNRLLHSNNFAYELYNESRILKHIIQRIRREPEKFSQFEQNRELVNFINSFTDRTQPLPAGWQLTKQTNNPMPQILFVDHIGKNITPFDPRLAFICLNYKKSGKQEKSNTCLSAPPLRRLNQLEKVLNEHYNPQMAQKIKTKLRLIANLGDRALLRYANDVDVARALSLLDQLNEQILKNNEESQQNENNEKNLNERFLKVIESFHENLKQLGYAKSQNRLRFRLRRDNLMEDAFQKILCLSPSKLRTYQLMVNFAEEDCLDYGGPSKELFFLLSKQLFNPKNGLFEYTSINSNRIQHRCLLDCFFTKPFYKILAKIPLELNDLLETDNELFNSLNWISKNSVNVENLELNFCVTEEVAGEVIDQSLLTVFDSEQLEFAISGNIFIDIEDWEKNTVYKGGYRENHVIIRWFWQCVRQMCNADRLKLLQFVTGSASVPFEGFKGLRGSNGLKLFCIERWGNEESLPRAHTCFNRLDLPAYSNKQKMFSKIMLAISESSYYAIE
uniref:HECT-type E3 ubiquitin transferase n=1 Tax=Meloidogyne javanica TaxID=6303 RepID=A0A915LCR7_MELJA